MKKKVREYQVVIYENQGGEWFPYELVTAINCGQSGYTYIDGVLRYDGIVLNTDKENRTCERYFDVIREVKTGLTDYPTGEFTLCEFSYCGNPYKVMVQTYCLGSCMYYIADEKGDVPRVEFMKSSARRLLDSMFKFMGYKDSYEFSGDNEKKFLDIFNLESING